MVIKTTGYNMKGIIITNSALNILESKGNRLPSQKQIDLVENFLKNSIDNYNRGVRLISPTKFSRNNYRMLLVEDQFFYTLTYTIIFKNLGFEVSHSRNNLDAMSHTFSSYDLVVISQHFLELNALLIARYIKQLGLKTLPALVAIVDNSYMTDENSTLFAEYGFQKVLPRSFSFDELAETLQQIRFN